MTSSPGPTPRATSARCKAVVPLLVATACLTSQNLAKAVSNSPMNRPAEEIQVVDIHSRTYSLSRPLRNGAATGIREEEAELDFDSVVSGGLIMAAHVRALPAS